LESPPDFSPGALSVLDFGGVLLSAEGPEGVTADDDLRLSVLYQPEPLKMMPAGVSTFFNVG
jgi:hypothetical protein